MLASRSPWCWRRARRWRKTRAKRLRLRSSRCRSSPMAPRGLLAEWDAARKTMTLFGAAKVAFPNRRTLAKHLGLPEASVRLIEQDVGGGFGVRGEYYPEDFLIPFAARRLEQPVKWTEDRRENLMASNHSREMDAELEILCERDGRVVALRGKVWVDVGAYFRANGTIPPRNVAQFLSGP